MVAAGLELVVVVVAVLTLADAEAVGLGELAAWAVLTTAECRLHVERLRRKMIGKIASRVNIKKKGLYVWWDKKQAFLFNKRRAHVSVWTAQCDTFRFD